MATAKRELNLVVMNANGPGNAENRRKGIAKLLDEEEPLLVFMQEFNWKNLHQRQWRSLVVPDYYQYVGHAEAGFVYDTREITLTRYDNNTDVIRMHERMRKKGDFTEYAELPRMCICMMESKGAPSFKLLVISWHGPHNGFKTSTKEEVVRSFCELVILLKDEYQLPVIVGGDFNLKATSVEKCLHEDLHVIKLSKFTIDMLLVDKNDSHITDEDKLEKVKWNTDKEKLVFDHVPLKIAFHP
ncbi:uncharacterized protein LOC121386902 [Gigantopelta aegis]|uniref:uncharacterized protein LOC121386902 n=1 Tax=Gigantopelta aegis TaxID=1735272 RepID=UPI001B8884CF|nr:uncharacterized protein LOC121386902 [Gigantopelta aegis]